MTNHCTGQISPGLIFSQLWALVAGAASLFYFVDNVSDMLPVPPSRRRYFCHFDDAHSTSLLIRLLKAEGGAAE